MRDMNANEQTRTQYKEVNMGQYKVTFWWLDGKEIAPTVEVFISETCIKSGSKHGTFRPGHWRFVCQYTRKGTSTTWSRVVAKAKEEIQ